MGTAEFKDGDLQLELYCGKEEEAGSEPLGGESGD